MPLSGSEIYPPPPELGALDRMSRHGVPTAVRNVFQIWVLVFGLVGAQTGWVLRPFIGDPSKPFTFFRERQSNFFEGVVKTTGRLLSGEPKKNSNWQKSPPSKPASRQSD